ncbi:haloacid dehalogenase-like hydrolase [uncultured Leptotrichia sp.]|jgi:HAD phosphoserine phosphatase-like hydrolase, family IB|uniref:HAD-IB family phosphatase n=1 Tax=uncultured Leptotrichia sp. TaxID=159271 RepID=UPI001A516BA9|nr:HAD-IB family phosphatase [uncultured Leptotrichia sp.]VTX49118.1 haloacid dehalogenase-like hydrolase [uncultured Leptotrichia sp.]
MNVYDFDKTIYDGDSTLDFYVFSIKKDLSLLRYFPKQFLGIIFYYLKIISKERYKEFFFSFLKGIDDIDKEIEKFWNKNEVKIKDWYLNQRNKNDIVISASPEWLLKPIINKLGINLIATKVDKKTGELNSLNCYGDEKVKRFKKIFPKEEIENFYSDHFSDTPMSLISKHSWIIKGDKVKYWREE